MNINLSKEELIEEVSINLSKSGFDPKSTMAKVAFVIDESGSMSKFYNSGVVKAILDKLLAVSYHFDDDGDIDMFAFNSVGRMLPQADQSSYGSYKFSPNYGMTAYKDVMSKVDDYYYKASSEGTKTNILSRIFGGKKEVNTLPEGRNDSGDDLPVYVFFLTDGDTQSRTEDVKFINSMVKTRTNLFVQFIGVGPSSFDAVTEIVRVNPKNADLLRIKDLDAEGDQLLSNIITRKVYDIIKKKEV